MTNVEALQALYAALGGDPADVADASTIVEVLNAIAAKYEGDDDATLNPDAIANIAAVAGNLTPAPTSEYNATLEVDGTEFVYSNAVLKSISIPDSVTSIGEYAFLECANLTDIIIPDSVTSIGGGAFNGCTSLTDIVIPNNVTTIDGETFSGCTSLTDIVIPDSVTSIGGYAFNGCTSLTDIVIPNNVTTIDDTAFEGCTSLETITINKAEGSITDAPWSAPETAQIVWTG